MQTNRFSQILLTIVALTVVVLMLQYVKTYNIVVIPLSELELRIDNKEITQVDIEKNSGRVTGTFKDGSEAITVHKTDKFNAVIEQEYVDELITQMRANGVKYEIVNPSFWDTILSPNTLLLVAVFTIPIIFLFWLMNRQMQSGGNNQAINFGKSRARLASDGKKKITFADVAGVDEAVEELREVVDFLRDPKKYEALGAEIPKGVLLIGPPGCGTTHLAATAVRASAARTMSVSRPSTRCSWRWTASRPTAESLCWRPPTGPTCWIRRCCVPAVLTAAWWSTPRI